MKKILFTALLSLSVLFMISGCEKDFFEKYLDKHPIDNKDVKDTVYYNAKVVKDCSGSYLHDLKLNVDFKVCNKQLLNAYKDGTPVYAIYNKVDACNTQDTSMVCMMYHEHKGLVEVLKIAAK